MTRGGLQYPCFEVEPQTDGSVPRLVYGSSQTDYLQNLAKTTNRLFQGASILDVFHEEFHGLRARARAQNVVTRDEELSWIRAVDSILAGKTDREGRNLTLLPENFDSLSEADQDVVIDEASSKIAEAEIIRNRKGGGMRGIPVGIVSRNLAAISKIIGDKQSRKFRSFLNAFRSFFGLATTRAHEIQRSIADGTLSRDQYEDHLAKIYGIDEQQEYDAGVSAQAAALTEGLDVSQNSENLNTSGERVSENDISFTDEELPDFLRPRSTSFALRSHRLWYSSNHRSPWSRRHQRRPLQRIFLR
ncbi:MAG: hypothetical protein QM680_13085 [Luteolibacter sp.]